MRPGGLQSSLQALSKALRNAVAVKTQHTAGGQRLGQIGLGGGHAGPRPSASNYAVIDGKVCTDRSEVRAEALSALQTIQLEDDDDAFAALGMMERQ